jgi:Flp pilus assembly pilin Flp
VAVGLAVVLTFVGILVLVSVVVVVVLLTMGNQIANVFSNVAAALGSPSP